MKVLISICTKDRDDLLERCLAETSKIRIPEGVEVGLCVAVNKDSGFDRTREVVALAAAAAPFRIWLVNEAKAGIPHARNRGLSEALAGDWSHIAFIDDDAYPDREWLVRLLDGLASDCCGATGPQVPVFPEGADARLIETRFYDERRVRGKRTSWAATNNAVVNLDHVREHHVAFDGELAMTGSSDKLFFLQLTKACGKPLAWVPSSIVYEPVSPARMTPEWMRRRAYRYGANGFMVRRKVHGSVAAFMFCLLRGGYFLTIGFAKYVLASVGQSTRFKADSSFFHGLGFYGGLFSRFRMKQYV